MSNGARHQVVAKAVAASASASLDNRRAENIGEVRFTSAPAGLEISIRVVRVLPGTYSLVLHQGSSCRTQSGRPFSAAGDTYRATDAVLDHLRVGPSGIGVVSVRRSDLELGSGPRSILGRALMVWSRANPVACGVIRSL